MKGSIVIARNMEDVFEFLLYPGNLIDKQRTGWISFDLDGPVSAGSTFNANFKIGPIAGAMKYEVTRCERPYRLALLVTSPPADYPHRGVWPVKRRDSPAMPPMEDVIELTAAPGGTRLTRTFGSKSRNAVTWIMSLLFVPLANWGMRRDLRRLKARIESELP